MKDNQQTSVNISTTKNIYKKSVLYMQEIETCYFRKYVAAFSFTTRKNHFGEKITKAKDHKG